jgi:hypothetical protein
MQKSGLSRKESRLSSGLLASIDDGLLSLSPCLVLYLQNSSSGPFEMSVAIVVVWIDDTGQDSGCRHQSHPGYDGVGECVGSRACCLTQRESMPDSSERPRPSGDG